ncbi:MAG: hypothetical protein ACSHX4_08325 [Opitutaceae bacterium]
MFKSLRLYQWPLVALMCLLASICNGQNRPVRILYYQAPSGAPTEANIYVGAAPLGKIDLPRSNFSGTFEIPRGDILLSFLPAPLGPQEKMPERAPAAKIPETWDKVLLLVFENDRNPIMPIRVQPINASDDVFGPGSIYMVNFSDIGIAGAIGDKELQLKPKSVKIIKDPIPQNGFYNAKLDAYIGKGEKPRRFIKQMWQHEQNTRQILFIFPRPAPRYATYYCAPVEGF